ncbi:MAG TPA: hypothetical protein VGL32_04545 [Acidimicrobiales bacterium]|jgi:hypothetical protein
MKTEPTKALLPARHRRLASEAGVAGSDSNDGSIYERNNLCLAGWRDRAHDNLHLQPANIERGGSIEQRTCS